MTYFVDRNTVDARADVRDALWAKTLSQYVEEIGSVVKVMTM